MTKIPINEVYDDVSDTISQAENGYLSYSRFNRFALRGQLRWMDWVTGDISAIIPPHPYLSQKNKDWLSHLIVRVTGNVANGIFPKPNDYYQLDNWYVIGSETSADCDDEDVVVPNTCNTPGEILDGQQFYQRCNTFIEELKPDNNKPICKMVGDNFEFLPINLGGIAIEYIKYPKKPFIGTKFDPIYNEEVYDPATSIDFELPEAARESLTWFIVNSFADSVRERALKETNLLTGKTVRDGK